jgi:hypothetical protein
VSRNLLAHVRRVADEFGGSLPPVLPGTPAKAQQGTGGEQDGQQALEPEAAADGAGVAESIGMYFSALEAHLRHHGDEALLEAHLPAVRLCAERLIGLRVESEQRQIEGEFEGGADGGLTGTLAGGLRAAARLAQAAGGPGDAARWESEAAYLATRGPAGEAPAASAAGGAEAGAWTGADHPAGGWLSAVRTAGAAVWEGCGVRCDRGEITVEPSWPSGGTWWALLGLPLANGKHLSLLWDGETLHATQPLRSSLPLALCKRIQIHQTDEFDFDPYFELTRETHAGDTASAQRFQPKFSAG